MALHFYLFFFCALPSVLCSRTRTHAHTHTHTFPSTKNEENTSQKKRERQGHGANGLGIEATETTQCPPHLPPLTSLPPSSHFYFLFFHKEGRREGRERGEIEEKFVRAVLSRQMESPTRRRGRRGRRRRERGWWERRGVRDLTTSFFSSFFFRSLFSH